MHLPQLINVWSVGRPLAIRADALVQQRWNISANAATFGGASAHTTPEPAPDLPANDPIPTEVPDLDPVPVQDPIPHQQPPIRARFAVV